MYLEQVFSFKNKKAMTFVSIVFLLLLIPFGFDSREEIQQNLLEMKKRIAEIGELPFYVISLLIFGFFLFILFLIVKLIHDQTITKFTTSRPKIDFSRIFFAVLVYGGVWLISFGADYVLYTEDFVWNFNPESFIWLVLISFFFLPLQTSFEEYLFRGYLMKWFGFLVKNRWVPFFATSILFGLAHASNPEVGELGYGLLSVYIISGFLFATVTLMDEGLELALGIHFVNNFLGAILITSHYSVLQTPALFRDVAESSPFVIADVLYEMVLIVIVILIFAKKYKWTNWKEKLFGKIKTE